MGKTVWTQKKEKRQNQYDPDLPKRDTVVLMHQFESPLQSFILQGFAAYRP
jgi:hypothetical protein